MTFIKVYFYSDIKMICSCLFWDIWHVENLVKITNNVPSSKICSFLGSATLIRCWEKYRSHQCFTLAGIWVDASPSPRRRTCCNSRQATLEVDKVGNRVLSCNTTSSATRVRTSRGDRILLLFPSAPLWLDSQFGAEEKEQASILADPPGVADPIKLWLPPWR